MRRSDVSPSPARLMPFTPQVPGHRTHPPIARWRGHPGGHPTAHRTRGAQEVTGCGTGNRFAYSPRSASTGSSLAAVRAGMKLASAAHAARTSATSAYVAASVGRTSKRMLAR